MKTRLDLIVLATLSLTLGAAGPLRSQEKSDAETDEEQAKIKAIIEQAVDWYDVLPDAAAKGPMPPRVVISWRNPVRVHTGAALLAVWIQQGRPEAMASIYEMNGRICHEFGSLARSKGLVARDKSAVVWAPGKAGVDFRDVPDAPAPAENPTARFRQMKAIAERFTARLPELASGKQEELRLLPKPLYRYELKGLKDADPSLQDGAMFAYVMGTDPEVILLLEAVGRDDKVAWKYAFSRATGTVASASLGNAVVWSEGGDAASSDPTSTQFLIQRPLP